MSKLKKMYLLESGKLVASDRNPIAVNNTAAYKYIIPIPVILLEHETEGLILLDTGVEYTHFPISQVERLLCSPLNRLDYQLVSLGYTAKDINHIVLSHWHFDHTCQIHLFPQATLHIKEKEYQGLHIPNTAGFMPQEYESFLRFQKECPKISINLLPDVPEYDLFGDNSLICLDTKGHTCGHQSFLVNLPQSGQWLFAADAAHVKEYLIDDALLGNGNWSLSAAMTAIQKLKAYQASGLQLIFGHDPFQWESLNKAPQYYM